MSVLKHFTPTNQVIYVALRVNNVKPTISAKVAKITSLSLWDCTTTSGTITNPAKHCKWKCYIT